MAKTKELKNYTYFGKTHVGLVRKVNEDAFAFFESINGSLFVLCDGMGGIKGGKKAAELTIAEIEKTINDHWEINIPKLLFSLFEKANNAVFKHFISRKYKPGTTLALVLIRNNKVWYAHVGDSRIYYQTGRKLFQITRDHSYVQDLIDLNEIRAEEAANHPQKNEITKAIGINPVIHPEICNDPVNPGDNDFILLCSDGLSNELSDKNILEILQNNKTEKTKVDQLIDQTLKKGAPDNVTVQLIRFFNTGKRVLEKTPVKNSKKRKTIRISGILLLLMISITIIWIYRDRFISQEKNFKIEERRYSNELMYNLPKNPLMLELVVNDKKELQDVLSRFHYDLSDVEIVETDSRKNIPKKIKIPVKNIYFHRPGRPLYTYPGIRPDNLIDVFRVNQKSRLYFLPGERIIVPLDEKK
jgi:serine/threonine protein phosphatase PrpC